MKSLDTIVADVRRRLAERKENLPLRTLQAMPAQEYRPSLLAALRGPQMALIAEVKRASPATGPLRTDLDVPDLVRHFERAGAAAIAVLTEQDSYLGSLDDLAAAVQASSLPVLQEDLILDEYQLHEARVRGAVAVLLVVAVLDHRELQALAETAHRLELEVVAEVHDESQLERALTIDEAIIGINNRDLATQDVTLETTFRLISGMPPERLVVSESGLRGRGDFVRLQAAGVDGVLVGEHLLRQADVEAAVRELLPQ